MLVAIDTNAVASALLFNGRSGLLIHLWKTEQIQPFASKEIIKEYIKVLA